MLKKNIIANLVGRAWGFISVYLFVPLYLRFLGIEAYSLVGFYSTLLAVLAFADMGFTATLNREMARLSVREDLVDEKQDLLRTYEITYLGISSMLAVVIWLLAPLIVEGWLNTEALPPSEMISAIRLMGIAIAFQLLSGLFIGGLMGLQQQVRANSIQIVWSIFRGFGATMVLWLISPTILAFTVWQLISNVLCCLLARTSLWRTLQVVAVPRFKWQTFRNTWRYAIGMTGMAAVFILLTQTDKLVVSKMLPLSALGFYTLATTLAAFPLMLASPIASAVFPKLTGLIAIEDRTELSRLYQLACETVAAVTIPVGLTIAFFATDVILVWTGSAIAGKEVGQVASLLVMGQLMQAITVVPYNLALAHGNVRLNLQMGVASIILITPLLILLVTRYGLVGAGLSWLLMNLCTTSPYMFFLHRRFLPGELQKWVVRTVVRPLLVAIPCVLLGRWFVPQTDSRLMMFGWIGLVGSISVLTTVATVPELRRAFMRNIRGLPGAYYGT